MTNDHRASPGGMSCWAASPGQAEHLAELLPAGPGSLGLLAYSRIWPDAARPWKLRGGR